MYSPERSDGDNEIDLPVYGTGELEQNEVGAIKYITSSIDLPVYGTGELEHSHLRPHAFLAVLTFPFTGQGNWNF